MPVNKIIVDNKQTKAERISSEKIQLDLVAIPMDEENDAEPNLSLNLYINGELLKTLQSDENGFVKENLIVNDEGGEQVIIKLEDVISGIQSKIKCVMVLGGNDTKQDKEEMITGDKQEIIEFVKKNGWNLSDERCKDYINDFDVVIEAVKQNGLALQFASENLKNNYDIVVEAVKQNGLALKIVPLFKDDLSICVSAVNQNVLAYDLCGEQSILSEELLEIVFKKCLEKKEILDKCMKLPKLDKTEFREIILDCNYRTLLKTNHSFIKNNKEIISLFMNLSSAFSELHVFEKIGDSLKNDSDFLENLLEKLFYKKFEHKNFILENIINKFIPNKLKNDMIFMSKLLDILYKKALFDKESFYLFSVLLSNIGETLIFDVNFTLIHFDNYCKCNDFHNNDASVKLKKYTIINLLKGREEIINNKKFILNFIKNSSKSQNDINLEEPYWIYNALLAGGSVLLREEDFLMEMFNEMSDISMRYICSGFSNRSMYSSSPIPPSEIYLTMKKFLSNKDKKSLTELCKAYSFLNRIN